MEPSVTSPGGLTKADGQIVLPGGDRRVRWMRVGWMTVLATMGRQFWDQIRPRKPYERFLYLAGAALVLSGIVHAGVFVVDGGAWYGAVSWRKPIVFGLSFGVSLWSIGWVLGRLPARRVLGWVISGPLGTAALVEVALITMQRWRGVPSHFNDATPLDSAVFGAMFWSVAVVVAATVAALAWSVVSLRGDAVARWAAATGLLLMLAAGRIGQDMISSGVAYVESTGSVPSGVLVEPAGSIKLAHAVGLHGIQVLGVLAVMLSLGRLGEATRRWLTRAASAAYAGGFVVVTIQAYQGRALWDLPVPLAATLVITVAVLVWAAVVAARAWTETAAAVATEATADPVRTSPSP